MRDREIKDYLHGLLCDIENGDDIGKASFDHGDYKDHLKQHLSNHLKTFIFKLLWFIV